MPWDVLARIINATGCAVSLFILVKAGLRQYKGWNNKTSTHWWALAGWVALGLEGAIESLILHIQPGPRTVIQTLVIVLTLRALVSREPVQADSAFKRKEDKHE